MIKFFRKIRYNLMESRKTSQYLKYAIGEIFLVMLGILLALQVNNWNEHRKSQVKELNLVKQLLEDAKADSTFFESRIAFQKQRDTLFNNLLNLHKQLAVDSILELKANANPFFFRLAYQSNLINNNPDAYKNMSDESIKSKLRDYAAKYDYVANSIELNNRICEEYGVPLEIKYYTQREKLPETPTYKDFLFAIEDDETVASLQLFKKYGINYLIQVQNFLKANHELKMLLETYIKEN